MIGSPKLLSNCSNHYNRQTCYFLDVPQEIIDVIQSFYLSASYDRESLFCRTKRGIIVEISSFKDLLFASKKQREPQRLLLMFAQAELPSGNVDVLSAAIGNKQGGELRAVMCVDKLPEDLIDFEHLVAESKHTGKDWSLVFVTSMSGKDGIAPSNDDASRPLDMMVESLRNGNIGNYLAFNRDGDLVQFF